MPTTSSATPLAAMTRPKRPIERSGNGNARPKNWKRPSDGVSANARSETRNGGRRKKSKNRKPSTRRKSFPRPWFPARIPTPIKNECKVVVYFVRLRIREHFKKGKHLGFNFGGWISLIQINDFRFRLRIRLFGSL